MKAYRYTMRNYTENSSFLNLPALTLGESDEGHLREGFVEFLNFFNVLPGVQGCQRLLGTRTENGKMQLLEMEVDHIELIRLLSQKLKHHHVIWQSIFYIRIEPQGLLATCD